MSYSKNLIPNDFIYFNQKLIYEYMSKLPTNMVVFSKGIKLRKKFLPHHLLAFYDIEVKKMFGLISAFSLILLTTFSCLCSSPMCHFNILKIEIAVNIYNFLK